jgi:dTDP-3-amino-2,3,6-trideoxy-4-keto-D-glucose/dTDP-3-amino-3,4,6-trideoxy-alpha-D-glucose/dTDP-2,6-dideoxy-D-kanosamine transaminase
LAEVTARVIESGRFILGGEVEAFEHAFAEYCGTGYCLGVGNGTDALEISLRALDCGPGDEVITVANAGAFGSVAIFSVGARPVYVDVEAENGLIDPDTIAAAIRPATKAIIVTHLYGKLADMDKICLLAAAAGIPIIEDAAQAHGARRHGRHAGSWGALGCFSFYPTKNLGALGDGGAIVTSDKILADRVRALRQYGWAERFQIGHPGGRNSRLDEIQAAVLMEKLTHLDAMNAERRRIAESYRAALDCFPITLPDSGEDHVFHLLVARQPTRDQLRSTLGQRGIDTDIHYPMADYRHPGIRVRLGGMSPLPRTERWMAEILTLPCFPGMTDAEVRHVTCSIKAALDSGGSTK